MHFNRRGSHGEIFYKCHQQQKKVINKYWVHQQSGVRTVHLNNVRSGKLAGTKLPISTTSFTRNEQHLLTHNLPLIYKL